MDHQRPRGREKHVTGPGKSVNKRGEGLHTGPVGDAGGYADRKEPSGGSGQRSGGTRSGGGMKLLILLAVLLLGGGLLLLGLGFLGIVLSILLYGILIPKCIGRATDCLGRMLHRGRRTRA